MQNEKFPGNWHGRSNDSPNTSFDLVIVQSKIGYKCNFVSRMHGLKFILAGRGEFTPEKLKMYFSYETQQAENDTKDTLDLTIEAWLFNDNLCGEMSIDRYTSGKLTERHPKIQLLIMHRKTDNEKGIDGDWQI